MIGGLLMVAFMTQTLSTLAIIDDRLLIYETLLLILYDLVFTFFRSCSPGASLCVSKTKAVWYV